MLLLPFLVCWLLMLLSLFSLASQSVFPWATTIGPPSFSCRCNLFWVPHLLMLELGEGIVARHVLLYCCIWFSLHCTIVQLLNHHCYFGWLAYSILIGNNRIWVVGSILFPSMDPAFVLSIWVIGSILCPPMDPVFAVSILPAITLSLLWILLVHYLSVLLVHFH